MSLDNNPNPFILLKKSNDMFSYNELHETLRKEKQVDQLQLLPNRFLEEFCEYIHQQKELSKMEEGLFSDIGGKSKKQLENAYAIFKELILKRKRKILELVFVVGETGVMKKDYENMLSHEKEIFDQVVKAFEESDKKINETMKQEKIEHELEIIFKQDIEQFVDHGGKYIGPFKAGEKTKINGKIAEILISEDIAKYL